MTSYQPKHYADGGRLYVVVTLKDGSTFGQYIFAGTTDEMDRQVVQAVTRIEQEQTDDVAQVQLGAVRTVPI